VRFFCQYFGAKKFQTQNAAFVIFGAKILYEKRAYKMLMKLTPVIPVSILPSLQNKNFSLEDG